MVICSVEGSSGDLDGNFVNVEEAISALLCNDTSCGGCGLKCTNVNTHESYCSKNKWIKETLNGLPSVHLTQIAEVCSLEKKHKHIIYTKNHGIITIMGGSIEYDENKGYLTIIKDDGTGVKFWLDAIDGYETKEINI